ncbi:DUF4259 domain-containing protein [Anatilimnocola sp. NA78]|uniref:DUF4259 domain-containing protein n=1 Tax=Anatilimnocola sp. NA78 TaxID=3415683 RepID=UPI003CE5A3E4
MGAWGEGVFENDQASDWIDELVESGQSSAIDKLLLLAVKAKRGGLEADEASAALAAAEVVAAARGHRHADLPAEVKEWLGTSGYSPNAKTVKLCVQATERILKDSELQELWEEAGELPAWKRGISGLLSRLAKPAQPTKAKAKPQLAAKAKPQVAAKAKPGAPSSPRAAVAALKKKRVFVVTQPGKSAHNVCVGRGAKSDRSPLNDADMVHFEQLPMLEDVTLCRYRITDAGLQPLAAMSGLESLELSEMPLTDACAGVFERLTKITSLNLKQTRIGDAVLWQIARMAKLAELHLGQTAVTDIGVRQLLNCKALTLLHLTGTQITDISLRELAKFPALTHLNLGGTRLTTAGVKLLKSLSTLQHLSLDETAVDDEACAAIAGWQQLDSISLDGTKVTGQGLRKLTGLKKLTFIRCNQLPLTDDDVPTLLLFPPEATVFALKTKITAKGKKAIAAAGRSTIYV